MQQKSDTAPSHDGPLMARDVMTPRVICVTADTPTPDIARLLLDNRISAVPVVDRDGVPIGMVSEGDILGRGEDDRISRTDWWLALLAGRQPLDDTFQARLTAQDRTAQDVMAAPLVTVSETTPVGAIARLLAIHHIKRVPVLKDGRMVGIVSRADLLRAVAAPPGGGAEADHASHPRRGFLAGLFGEYHRPAWEVAPIHHPDAPAAARQAHPDRIAAADFRHLVEDFQTDEARQHDAARRAAAEQRRHRARDMIDTHVFDPAWRVLLHGARVAAEAGQTEYMLLQFPVELCLDQGRAINVAERGWPRTLRGEAAEIYLRWERDLRPQGFTLTARILDFPDGRPGSVGLFLGWGG
jgi:CBS domain-containing protein